VSAAVPAPLAGLRALDLTGQLGWLLGKILADLGAEVVKVDPPGGDPGRLEPPLLEGPAGAAGAEWVAFNAGKQRADLDLSREEDRARLVEMAAVADFVIDSARPGSLEALGIGWPHLSRRNPALVMTSITPYGQDGPLAGVPASDLELMAAGGAVWLTGDPDRPPVRVTLPQAGPWASAYAAVGTLIAHHHRARTGCGQHVDASAQCAVIPMLVHAPSFWEMLGVNPVRAGAHLVGRNVHGAAMRNVWPCLDGYLTWAIYGGPAGRQSNRGLVRWMAEKGMAPDFLLEMDWDRFDVASVTPVEVERMEAAIAPFFLTVPKREFLEQAEARRMLGYVVATAEDIAADPQLTARGVWREVEVPELGTSVRLPGGWYRACGGGQASALVQTPSAVGPHALAGVRVVEFGGFAAGPAVGKHLADHGAEVIHVESRSRPDGFRTNYPPYTGNQPGLERAGMFAITNGGKLGITLDLKSPHGREIAVRLIERADVVIENFTPGTMDRLGLGHAGTSERNPGLVTLSTCNQGATGPHSKRAGFGTQLTALSGFTHLTGWPDRAPALLWGPFIDYIAVAYGAVAVLAALEERRRTGLGCHIDLSQYEAGIQFVAPVLARHFVTGEVPERAGNRHPAAAPHAVFPCVGTERWCAISIHDDAEWQRFREALGEPDWARDPGLDGVGGRLAAEAHLERRVAEWTSTHGRDEVVALLRAAGVHVAPVNDMQDVFTDPQLVHRRAFRRLEHPVMGAHSVPGPSFLLPETPDGVRSAAPLLGQHNRDVLCTILGLTEEEAAALEAAGALD
jgi:crotonobetainyl-CoA:carnitine CoA-transferase CaiB-like acyl-CoA transferase